MTEVEEDTDSMPCTVEESDMNCPQEEKMDLKMLDEFTEDSGRWVRGGRYFLSFIDFYSGEEIVSNINDDKTMTMEESDENVEAKENRSYSGDIGKDDENVVAGKLDVISSGENEVGKDCLMHGDDGIEKKHVKPVSTEICKHIEDQSEEVVFCKEDNIVPKEAITQDNCKSPLQGIVKLIDEKDFEVGDNLLKINSVSLTDIQQSSNEFLNSSVSDDETETGVRQKGGNSNKDNIAVLELKPVEGHSDTVSSDIEQEHSSDCDYQGSEIFQPQENIIDIELKKDKSEDERDIRRDFQDNIKELYPEQNSTCNSPVLKSINVEEKIDGTTKEVSMNPYQKGVRNQ